MINFIIISAIVAAIAIGYKTKLNVGLIALSFSYLIGCFLLKMNPKEVINLWPMSIFFAIFSVSMFYNFAVVNGTMDKLANHILYKTKNFPEMLYIIIYLISVLLSAMGAGFFTVMAVFCPIAIALCKKSGKNILIGAQAVNWGASGGANLMTSGSGIVFQGLMKDAGFENEAFQMGIPIFSFTVIYPLIVLIVLFLVNRFKNGNISKTLEVERPLPFNAKQKINLFLIALTFVLVLIFPVMNILNPEVQWIANINSMLNIGLVCITMSVISLLLHLADQKEVLIRIPWTTIIMLCGMGILIQIAVKAGVISQIGTFMDSNVPEFLIPTAFCLVAGAMSFFSSTLSVVTPSLFPIIGAMVAANPNLNATLLFTATVTGSLSTNISPFSSAGSLMQMSAPTEDDREWMFDKQMFVGLPITYGLAIVSVLILTFVMT